MALQNLFGDLALEETLQLIAIYLEQIATAQTRVYPDTTGSMRVAVTSGTVTTVSTVSSVAQMSGYGTNYDQYAQLQTCAEAVRNKIVVS